MCNLRREQTSPEEFIVMEVDPSSVYNKPFPPFFIYVGWTFVVVVILTCSAMSVLYGMTYGVHISRQW